MFLLHIFWPSTGGVVAVIIVIFVIDLIRIQIPKGLAVIDINVIRGGFARPLTESKTSSTKIDFVLIH